MKLIAIFLTADESLLDGCSAIQFAQKPQPYGIFNIKLMKCGGILGAREIAMIAANAESNYFGDAMMKVWQALRLRCM